MDCDKRFTLFDSKGAAFHAAKLDGKFQVGKDRQIITDSLADFASAIIKRKLGGRFLTPSGKKSVMGIGGRARRAIRYELEPEIAQSIGVPSRA